MLRRFVDLLEQQAHELVVMESLGSGKPIRECQNTDVPETIHTILWHADLIDKIYDNTAPVGSNALALVVREPIGVVDLMLPWNFPLLMLAWKIGPSLAAGRSIVVKPAKETTLTALHVAELAHEAAGVFNVPPGGGREVGEPRGKHHDVAMVSFTGSTDTRRLFLRYVADSNLKRVVLECDGKNSVVVLTDVEDLDPVAQQLVSGAFWNMGENCSASSRLIVHADIKDALLKCMAVAAREWKMGKPLDPDHRLGSLVSKFRFEKVRSYRNHAASEKLRVAFGGGTREGNFVEPTVVDGVGPDSRLFIEEIFGPILSVTTFRDIFRRPQGVRLRRPGQVDLGPRPVHRNQDHMDQCVGPSQAGSIKSKNKTTLIGLIAVLLWSSIVDLIRGVSESLGATGGAAMFYTVASVLLLFTVGFPRIREFPRSYFRAC